MGQIHPKIFMRSLEEQLRKVKTQYYEVKAGPKYFELSPEELLKNSSMWFLSVVQNTNLVADEIDFSAHEYLMDESLARQKSHPYGLLYPSLVWFMCNLGEKRLEYLFGVGFCDKLLEAKKEFKIDGVN